MRSMTVLNDVLALEGARVVAAQAGGGPGAPVVVRVVLTSRRWLVCPACEYRTTRRFDDRSADSRWRHLDLSGRRCELVMRRRRLRCPTHGVITEGVPFARYKARFTRVFEDLVVWLCTRADKTTVAGFARVTWRAVGAMCERVAEDLRDEDALAGLASPPPSPGACRTDATKDSTPRSAPCSIEPTASTAPRQPWP